MSRLLNMITRGIVRSSHSTTGFFRRLVLSLAADTPDDVDHFQVHGLDARPAANAHTLTFAVSGNAEHLVALVAGSSGLSLAEGETAIYNDHGWSIQLQEEGVKVVLNGVTRLLITEENIYLGNPNDLGLATIARQGDPVTITATAGGDPVVGTAAIGAPLSIHTRSM